MKKSFIIHIDTLSILKKLSDEQAGKLFKAISAYHHDEDVELDALTDIIFDPFRNQFNRDSEKYESFVQSQREKGVKSAESRAKNKSTEVNHGQPRSTTVESGQPKSTESTNSVSDSDKVSDTVSVSDSENESTGTKKFVPPSIDEVADYFFSISTDKKLGYEYSKIFAEKFIGHYTLTNWKYGKGKVPIKNWKLALTNSWNVDQWINEQEQKKNNGNTYKRPETPFRKLTRTEPPPHGTPFGQL